MSTMQRVDSEIVEILNKACKHLDIDSKVNVLRILLKAGAKAKGIKL